MFFNVLAAAPVAIWLYLLTARAGYWRMGSHLLPRSKPTPSRAKIIAVIPARNEADVVASAVISLLTQEIDPPLDVMLVDDESDDGTAACAQDAARAAQSGGSLSVIQSEPLPQGWTGKLWAVSQGVAWAERARPDYLLLTDGDIKHAPGTIQRLLAVAEAGGFDLASLMVRLASDSFAEDLLIPAFVYFFLQLYPPGWISNRMATTAGAAGGCMLIRAETLRSIGGIQAIANEVIDDCALAALVKRNKGRVWLGISDETTSLRSYGGFKGVGKMISRSAFNQLRHSVPLLFLTLAGLVTTYALPLLLLFSRRKLRVAYGVASCSLMSITYVPVLRLYRRRTFNVVTLPFVALFYAGATLHSAIQYWAGAGGKWKGRIQDRRA